jgi:alpha-1,3-fucosyltransferase
VAWVASHCETPSLREEIVQDLSRYIKVDTFGRCGTAACNVEGAQVAAGNCSSTIARDYKFYLSFENALCNDYVTEKLFHRLNSNLLPIVLGQVNYSRVAPPHSYVNALDFDSPRSLAKYLNQLDQNDSEYLSYFWWKDHYRVETDGMIQRSFCDLCAKLHEDVKSKSYSNFESWWRQAPEPQRDFSKVLKFLSKTQSEDQRQSMPRLRMSFAE